MQIYIKYIMLVGIIFLVIFVTSIILFCHKECSFGTYVDFKELRVNETTNLDPKKFGPYQVKLLDIDKTKNKCVFELRNSETGQISSGEVGVQDPILFTPYKEGKKPYFWVFLYEIRENSVLLMFRWPENKFFYQWRLKK